VRRTILAGLAVAGLAAAAASLALKGSLSSIPPSEALSASDAPVETPVETPAESRLSELPPRTALGEPRGGLFSVPAPAALRARGPKPVGQAPEPPGNPTPPAVPYRFAGTVVHGGQSKIVLEKGGAMLFVQPGEILEGAYRVESMSADELVLQYLPLGVHERLSLAAAQAPDASAGSGPRAARLRWEGPQRVKAGGTFDVTLSLASPEALRASPLQLAFDAKVLEPVAVRGGGFFGPGGSFGYRVNPEGSIIVTASGTGESGAAGELVTVTFKPLQAAAATEIRISTVGLQGLTGIPVPVEPLSVYRTSIAPES
jgi:hypothetical protein